MPLDETTFHQIIQRGNLQVLICFLVYWELIKIFFTESSEQVGSLSSVTCVQNLFLRLMTMPDFLFSLCTTASSPKISKRHFLAALINYCYCPWRSLTTPTGCHDQSFHLKTNHLFAMIKHYHTYLNGQSLHFHLTPTTSVFSSVFVTKKVSPITSQLSPTNRRTFSASFLLKHHIWNAFYGVSCSVDACGLSTAFCWILRCEFVSPALSDKFSSKVFMIFTSTIALQCSGVLQKHIRLRFAE